MRGHARLRAVLATSLALGAAAVAAHAPVAPPAPVLRDIHAIADLQGTFDRDAGKVRVVLLLSPT